MQYRRSANADTYAGTAHACGCAHTSTAQNLPALIDTHTYAHRANACTYTCAQATATQAHAHGKRSNRNAHTNASTHGAAAGQSHQQQRSQRGAQACFPGDLQGSFHHSSLIGF